MPTDLPIDPEAFKRFEHAGWVEVAHNYHDSFGRLTMQAVEPTLDAAGVSQGTKLLDVATGPGYVAAAGARRGARAFGIDFSSGMVKEARRLHPDVEFREGDAEALPFDGESFDSVTIPFGLVHFARPDTALAEAHRVLRPGGRVAFTVWDAPERAATFGIVLRAVEARGNMEVPIPPGPSFFRFSDPAECRRSLAESGFAEPSVRTLPLSWQVPSADALLDLFLESGVRTRALLRAQTPEALAAIRSAVHESTRPYERGGALELPTPCVLAWASKPPRP
jgi:ubiquinone/menaquinone biosynthesis C-methylase UbiE